MKGNHSSGSNTVYVDVYFGQYVILVAAALLDIVVRALTEGNSSNERQ